MNERDDEQNSSDEDEQEDLKYLFRSALDIGSSFIDVTPEHELTFSNNPTVVGTYTDVSGI